MKEQSSNLVDELLVMDAQDGDRQAMRKLVERWQKRLWRYAYHPRGNTEAAWDIAQESWIGSMKIFAWEMIHRNSIRREIKRLELRIAELSQIVRGK